MRPFSLLWLLAGCVGIQAAVQADPDVKSISVSPVFLFHGRICANHCGNLAAYT